MNSVNYQRADLCKVSVQEQEAQTMTDLNGVSVFLGERKAKHGEDPCATLKIMQTVIQMVSKSSAEIVVSSHISVYSL